MLKSRCFTWVYLFLWLALAAIPVVYALVSDNGCELVRHCLEGWLGGPLSGAGL